MIKLEQIKRAYDRKDMTPLIAVDNVEFDIMQGDFVSIIGRSGSGKSTLLNMIAGLLRPTSGKIFINGTDLWSMNDKDMSKLRNSKIGYVPQGMSLLSNLTVLDNVRLPFYFDKREGDGVGCAMNLLEQMGMQDLAHKYPAQLSGGEMRRAAIARALINNPRILIADEPTGDLDDETTKEVMSLFTEIHRKGITILMVTHEYDITSYGNRLYVMSSGKLSEKNNTVC